jgi:predicted DNA-binding protein (MmcQ/YjbR family)
MTLLDRVTRICMALPETSCDRHGSHATFRARKKIFAYFLDNHHGDGIVAIACKVHPGDNAQLVRAQPERFYLPAYIGPRGWVGLKLATAEPGLDVGKADWDEVKELVGESYQLTATPSKRVSRS